MPTPRTPRIWSDHIIGATIALAVAAICRVWNRVRQLGVIVRESTGALRAIARPARPWSDENSKPTSSRLQPVDGGAAEQSALAVEQVAVGRLTPEQAGNLVDEPLEDRLQLELAGDNLRRAQQRGLLAADAAGSRRASAPS